MPCRSILDIFDSEMKEVINKEITYLGEARLKGCWLVVEWFFSKTGPWKGWLPVRLSLIQDKRLKDEEYSALI